ncbi:hypothetical protein HHI36_021982 [Cryptolaemus montrouzieri]|uniref:Uncharacterized protein n=1 Tax=Cryptolaemus montrouzieri TaxID=559131 RepID=A0ABD2MYC9_9CUCU
MGKNFIGNPYNAESDCEDDNFAFTVEGIDYEISVDSVDIIAETDSEGDEDDDEVNYIIESASESDWLVDDNSYISDSDTYDDDSDEVIEQVPNPEIPAETILNTKPLNETSSTSSIVIHQKENLPQNSIYGNFRCKNCTPFNFFHSFIPLLSFVCCKIIRGIEHVQLTKL